MHFAKKTLPLILGLTVPVLALAGCPIPGLGTSPTPTPTASGTTAPAATRTTLVATKFSIGAGSDDGDRSLTVKNLGTAAVDLSKYVMSYEYDSSGTIKMQHLRIIDSTKASASLAAGAEYTFVGKPGCTDGKCVSGGGTLGGTTATEAGFQASHGAIALYKGVTTKDDVVKANMVDYVQYGTAKTYSHAADAVSAGLWDNAASYSVAPGAVNKSIGVKTAGATGSANWELK